MRDNYHFEDADRDYKLNKANLKEESNIENQLEHAKDIFWDELHEGGAFYDDLVDSLNDDFDKADEIIEDMENLYSNLPYKELISKMRKKYPKWAKYTKQWIEALAKESDELNEECNI